MSYDMKVVERLMHENFSLLKENEKLTEENIGAILVHNQLRDKLSRYEGGFEVEGVIQEDVNDGEIYIETDWIKAPTGFVQGDLVRVVVMPA